MIFESSIKKFKFWFIEEKRFMPPEEAKACFTDEGVMYATSESLFERCTPLQYIGFKDWAGKEICEGDILQAVKNEEDIRYVKYDDLVGFCMARGKVARFITCDIWRNYKIIGNVFENGGLLNE